MTTTGTRSCCMCRSDGSPSISTSCNCRLYRSSNAFAWSHKQQPWRVYNTTVNVDIKLAYRRVVFSPAVPDDCARKGRLFSLGHRSVRGDNRSGNHLRFIRRRFVAGLFVPHCMSKSQATTKIAAPKTSGMRWQTIAGVAVILATLCVAYWPARHGEFVLDDELLVTHNKLVRAPDGLYRIWFTTQPADYWPVTNTAFWLQWRLWKMDPTGYHAVNLLLHAANALLIWTILRQLAIPGDVPGRAVVRRTSSQC